MIVKNEEATIRNCLNSVSWADEVIVLDTGSTDRTIEICREHGAVVHTLDKWEGFGKARQQAVLHATNDWILTLDADEVLSPELQRELIKLREKGWGNYAYRMKARTFYLGRAIRFCGWGNESHLAIFNRQSGNFNAAEVHESIITDQPVKMLKHYLLHYPYPDLDMILKKMRLYAKLSGDKKQKLGKKTGLGNIVFRSFFKFFRMYFLKLGFLDGRIGFILCVNSAISTYFNHLSLWEKTRKNR